MSHARFQGWRPGKNTQGRGCLAVSLGTVGTGHSECLTWSLHLLFFAVSLPLPDPAIQGVASLGRGGGPGGLRWAPSALVACATRNCFGPEGHSWAAGTQPDSFLSQETACQHPAHPTAFPELLTSIHRAQQEEDMHCACLVSTHCSGKNTILLLL